MSERTKPLEPLLSVVICFRDWGLDRLATAIQFHFMNRLAASLELEVIVSDYGSRNADEVSKSVLPLGARIVRTETDAPWSRSAALNAGVAAARGRYVVATDADIVFSPSCYVEAVRLLSEQPNALYLAQCRDLPNDWGVAQLSSLLATSLKNEHWWQPLDEASTVRPRWGMGGFAAFAKSRFAVINGFDERMQIWGGEDNDFAMRFRRAGYPIRWLSRPDTRIFHIWHEPSQTKANETEEGRCALQRNREILKNDQSIVRNYDRTIVDYLTDPTVTVIIPTYRRALLLRNCLESCRRQTFKNFEVLVVENGDSDEAASVVDSFHDARFRYVKITAKGAAVARNVAIDKSRGRYIVIHDDDDIMVSTRIADHLRAMRPGLAGSYSGWIDFDHDSGQVIGIHPGKEFSLPAVLCNGKVLTHGALMLDRNVFSMFRYDESLSAGIDYGFLLLLARNGLRLAHTGTFGILRRMHMNNMTQVNCSVQKSSAIAMVEVIKSEIEAADYQVVRKAGLAAGVLSCHNRDAALEELAAGCLIARFSRLPKFKSLGEIDDWLDRMDGRDVKELLIGASPSAIALVTSRWAMRQRRNIQIAQNRSLAGSY